MEPLGAFDPRPKHFHGPQARGTMELPGFHTAISLDMAAPYAQMKVSVPWLGEVFRFEVEDWDRDLSIGDYPVILSLDMSGLHPLPDYDALSMTDVLQVVLEELPRYAKEGSLLDALHEMSESDYMQQKDEGPYGDPVTVGLFALAQPPYDAAAGALLGVLQQTMEDLPLFTNEMKEAWAERRLEEWTDDPDSLPDEIVMHVTGQYRYLEPIGEDRLVAVYFMKPFISPILDFEPRDDKEEQYIEEAEAQGYQILTMDDIDSGWSPATIHPVLLLGDEEEGRIEYHGTSYCNLIAALPSLASLLPVPPKPFDATKALCKTES